MPIQHPTYALPLQSANTIATKQSHDAELNRVVTILVENDRDLNATFERAIVTGPIVGEWDAGTGAFPTLRPNGDQIRVGDTWRVIGSGTVDGQAFYSGDYLQAITAGGGVTFNGNWARAALGQIEADRIAAETAAAEAQAYAEMAEFTRVTVIASGDGTATPITLPISVDSALRVQVFVNMTRWVPGDDYTVSGYDLAPVSPLVWPEGDRNLLILIDRPFDSMAPTSEDVTHDGQPISQILDRIDAQNTFYLSDYLHPDDLAFAEAGNTASQNETRVTAAVQAFHDAALGWMMTANNRHVTLVYPNIVLAINDEMFSEAWAELLWTTGGSRTNCRIVFQFNGVRFQTKNWVARAAVRTSGLYNALGITYAVPKVVFRYEARTPGNPRIETQGRIHIIGSDNPDTDPIGVKFKSINISQFDCFFFQALRNTAFYHENIFNSTFYNWQVNSCGYQPTEYGGNGFISETVRFQNAGRVITATEPVFDASHVGRRFMLVGAAAANGQGFQTHSGVIESVDSPTQITLTAATAPFRNVTDPVVASFEAIKATTTAGSNVVTLSAPITDNLAGRYVTLFGCGQNDIAYNGKYYGAMTVVVTAHSGDQITLAHPARLSRTNIPISFGTSMVITRGAENSVVVGSMAGRTDDCTYHDARIENGSSPFDGASMMAVIQHCSSTSFVGGTKFHGVTASTKNNFGANFANIGFDYATNVKFPESILTHCGYSSTAGKVIMNGGFIGVEIECDEVAYPDTTETATVLCDPSPDQISVSLRLGNSRTDGRVGNAVKARYGDYGNAWMIVAANSAARPLRGIDLIDGGEGEDTIVGTGTTPAIPDWPTDLHDVIATGDVFATGYGSTRANAASRIAAGFWTPQDGAVYTIGGLQYLGQTGATEIADLPGLVWHGYKTNEITLTTPAITLGTGQRISWQTSGDVEQAYLLANATQIDAFVGGANALRVTSGGVQVTGLLTGTAVTSSPTDATLGRLPVFMNYPDQTGNGLPWGLGASHAVNVPDNDANAITRAGFYRVGSSSTVDNVPDTAFGGVILHIPYSATYAAQTYIMTNGGTAGLMWIRHCNNGTWAAWRRVYTQGDAVGTVSQSGGVPTGALIERGSNANGVYVRFADGTQICQRRIIGIDITSAYATNLFRSDAFSWTFPAAFVMGSTNGANVIGRIGHESGISVNTAFGGLTTAAGTIRAIAGASIINTDVFLTATGRWF